MFSKQLQSRINNNEQIKQKLQSFQSCASTLFGLPFSLSLTLSIPHTIETYDFCLCWNFS